MMQIKLFLRIQIPQRLMIRINIKPNGIANHELLAPNHTTPSHMFLNKVACATQYIAEKSPKASNEKKEGRKEVNVLFW
jgi:hypothetical protein